MSRVEVLGKRLTIDSNHVIELPHLIREAFETKKAIVVLLDPNENLGKTGQFRNLLGFDRQGKELWVAKLPTSESTDAYMSVVQREPLIAYTWSGHDCWINDATGKITATEYHK